LKKTVIVLVAEEGNRNGYRGWGGVDVKMVRGCWVCVKSEFAFSKRKISRIFVGGLWVWRDQGRFSHSARVLPKSGEAVEFQIVKRSQGRKKHSIGWENKKTPPVPWDRRRVVEWAKSIGGIELGGKIGEKRGLGGGGSYTSPERRSNQKSGR